MKFKHLITTLDYHHGQASRTIISGYPPIPGRTMAEKSDFFDMHLSWLGRCLCREPRGHANMLGSIITEPVNPGSKLGILFLHPDGQFAMCGDSTIATAFAVLESGIVVPVEPETVFDMDTPAGVIRVNAKVKNGVVEHVSYINVPSFHLEDRQIHIDGIGGLGVSICYGGLFYGLVNVDQVGLSIQTDNRSRLLELGTLILKSMRQGAAYHLSPTEAGITLATFYEMISDEPLTFRVANIYLPGILGRTPSGTGMSALMALQHARGILNIGDLFIQESILGLRWEGSISDIDKKETQVAIIPEIRAKSYLMGFHQFVIDPDDPFQQGFTIETR